MRTPFRISHGKITFVLYNKPFPCGGNCLYCFKQKGLTKSTTLNEDTGLAQSLEWSGKLQIIKRFEFYNLNNSIGNKCDLAVKGDSFANHEFEYLREYVKGIYDFLNGEESNSLLDSANLQNKGKNRCVTFKVETRPDHINIKTCNLFLELGITTVELGVQSLNESVLKINNRGHDLLSIENATKLLKNFGFEVVYQVMVGLPGSNLDIDKSLLTEDLWQDRYNPDALKIYPCILLKKKIAYQKGLHDYYQKNSWKPIDYSSYIEFLKECYSKIPRYVHVNRIQRVIPSSKIEAGVNREIDRNLFSGISKCLWQRSLAQRLNDLEVDFSNYRIIYYKQGQNDYCFEAVFIDDIVLGYARLLILSNNSAIIRDIRVLGNMRPIGDENIYKRGSQHIGIGTALINRIEKVSQNLKIKTIIVKPSFGTVPWFMRKGYCQLNSFYFGKKLNSEKKIELPSEIDKLMVNG